MVRWTLAFVDQFVASLVLLGFRELFVLRDDFARRPDTSDAGADLVPESRTSAERARFSAFLAAMTVGGISSFASLIAAGYWLVTGRGPGGRLLASTAGSGGVGRRGLQALATEQRTAREAA